MSETAPEQNVPPAPDPNAPPGGPETQAPEQSQPQDQSSQTGDETFALKFVKRPTGDVHWNTAKGIWETITHAETGEPNQEYALLATIDGVEVTLQTFNAGGIETIIRAAQQAKQDG